MDPAPLSKKAIQQNSNKVGQMIYILFCIKTHIPIIDIYNQIKQFLFCYTRQDFLIDFRIAMSKPEFVKSHPPLLADNLNIKLRDSFLIGFSGYNSIIPSCMEFDFNAINLIMIDSFDIAFFKADPKSVFDDNVFFAGILVKKDILIDNYFLLFGEKQREFKLKFKKSKRVISSKNCVFCSKEHNFYAIDNYAMSIDEFQRTKLKNIPKDIKKNMVYIFCKYEL